MTPLRKQYLEDLQLRNYAPATQEAYVGCVARFARHFATTPANLGPDHIREYQLYLVQEKKAKWSVFNQTVCALRFLYRTTLQKDWAVSHIPFPRKETKLPVVLSTEEVACFFENLPSVKYRAIVMTAYGAGLRISEVLSLQPCDIDSKRMVVNVRDGKGNKDRCVMLSPKLLTVLREYYKAYRPKTWLFPGGKPGRPLTRSSVERACVCARGKLSGDKKVTPHTMRHSFATHLLDAGVNIRVIQMLLGHKSLRSTARYTHVAQSTVASTPSPLDSLPEPSKS
jgi:site-specific recombinase XerD